MTWLAARDPAFSLLYFASYFSKLVSLRLRSEPVSFYAFPPPLPPGSPPRLDQSRASSASSRLRQSPQSIGEEGKRKSINGVLFLFFFPPPPSFPSPFPDFFRASCFNPACQPAPLVHACKTFGPSSKQLSRAGLTLVGHCWASVSCSAAFRPGRPRASQVRVCVCSLARLLSEASGNRSWESVLWKHVAVVLALEPHSRCVLITRGNERKQQGATLV